MHILQFLCCEPMGEYVPRMDFTVAGVVPSYWSMVGQLIDKTSHADHLLNDLLAIDAGVPRGERGAWAAEHLRSKRLFDKLKLAAPISARVLGSGHETTQFLAGTRSRELRQLRNKVGHAHVVSVNLDPSAVVVADGTDAFRESVVLLDDLHAAVEEGTELLVHVTCLCTALPGSGLARLDVEDVN